MSIINKKWLHSRLAYIHCREVDIAGEPTGELDSDNSKES